VKLFLGPVIDTLHFRIESPLTFRRFLYHAEQDDLNALRNLAIHEMQLSNWYAFKIRYIFLPISCLMAGLEKLIISIEIPGFGDRPSEQWDDWDGWKFEGGPLIRRENLTLSGVILDYIFSLQSPNGHLFYFDNDHHEYAQRYPGYIPLWQCQPGHAYHRIFENYYLLGPDVLGVRRGAGEIIDYQE
jgi:hypothetical protein